MKGLALKLLAFAGCAAVVVMAAVHVIDAGVDEAGFLWRDASVELRPVRTLKGITLGESFGEVTARSGAFEIDASGPATGDPAFSLVYVQRSSRLRLRVVGERVTRVSYECPDPPDNTRINRVGCGDEGTRVLEVFGQGARRLCAKVDPRGPNAALARNAFAFDVLDTGTRYVVLEGRVRGLIVMEPEDLDGALGDGQLWNRCG
jgi:hypothetical protein